MSGKHASWQAQNRTNKTQNRAKLDLCGVRFQLIRGQKCEEALRIRSRA